MRNSNSFGTTSDLKVRVQMHGFSLVCASCVVFVGHFKATHPLCAPHRDTVWLPRSHCWVQYCQLYVLNDTQRGLHLLWPFCKTGVASDQCSVCVFVLPIIPYTLKRTTKNCCHLPKAHFPFVSLFVSRCIAAAEQQTFHSRQLMQESCNSTPRTLQALSLASRSLISTADTQRRRPMRLPVTCCRTTDPPPRLFTKVPLQKNSSSFHFIHGGLQLLVMVTICRFQRKRIELFQTATGSGKHAATRRAARALECLDLSRYKVFVH